MGFEKMSVVGSARQSGVLQAIEQTGFGGQPTLIRIVRPGLDFGLDAGDELMTYPVRAGRFSPAVAGQPFEDGLRQWGRHSMADPVVHYRLVSNLREGSVHRPEEGLLQ